MRTEDVQNRINELITELSDCREDERSAQNQILEVLSVAGAILGILFSAFHINTDIEIIFFSDVDKTSRLYNFCKIINENVTYARIMFWLSLLIFCTAFSYIIVLGTNNILRYYHIQNLEDRLHDLISNTPDDNGRGTLLHWSAYDAPIITRNIKHISSTHSALIHFCYSFATCCAVLFSMAMIVSLFLEIETKKRFDYIAVAVIIFLMLSVIFLFIRTSAKAKDVAQFAWDTAHENQKKRLEGDSQNLYNTSKSFRRIVFYLIYPKKQDWQKPVLIILGYICGIILRWDASSSLIYYIWRIIVVLFIFDFLAYQARYQINDIRGLKEDKEAGNENRLLTSDINKPGHIIKISFLVASVKIMLCVIMTIFLEEYIRKVMLTGLIILFISTILYEVARGKKLTWLIFIFVGMGYPLRFFLGFFSVVSLEQVTHSGQIVCFVLALWAYGSFSSILAWVKEVTGRMQKEKEDNNSFPASYEKKHFEYIQNIITNRYILGERHCVNGKVMPLREKCSIGDPWNLFMVFCSVCLFLTAAFGKMPKLYLMLEALICMMFILNINARHKKKVFFICVGLMCIFGKIFLSVLGWGDIHLWYVLFSIVQIIIKFTYFILSYQPQMKKFDYKKLTHIIMIKVLGEYALNIIDSENNNI